MRDLLSAVVILISLPGGLAQAQTPAASPSPVPTPKATASSTMTFQQAWDMILERSLRLQTQRLEVEASGERKLQSWGAFTPSLAVQATDSRIGEPLIGPTRGAQVVARLNLFRGGSDVAAVNAAKNDATSAKEKLGSERQVSEEEGAQALVRMIAEIQRRQIVEKIVKLQEDMLQVAQERYRQGLLPLQEVDKSRIDLENARAQLTDADTSVAAARAQLENLLGNSNIQIEWPWKEKLTQGPKLEDRTFDLQARPDWRSSVATIEAERYRRYQSLGLFLPSVDLSAGYGNLDLSNSDRRDWTAVLTLTVPLFDRFKTYTDYRLQSLTQQSAELRAESIRRQAPAEVESLRKAFTSARDTAVARERTSKVTEKLYGDNFQRFRMGRASVNDLAIDQKRLFDAQLFAVEGWASAHLSYVKLCHALGGSVAATGDCREQASTL